MPWIPVSWYWNSDSLSVEPGFRTLIVSGIRDSGFLELYSGFQSQGFGFHKQKFPGFRIPQAKISRIPDFTSKNFPDSGFHKQKFPGFQIPRVKISRIPDSSSKNFQDSRFHGQKFLRWIPESRFSDMKRPNQGFARANMHLSIH